MVSFSVTGINVHVITPAVCIVCIFYTCVVSDTATLICRRRLEHKTKINLKMLVSCSNGSKTMILSLYRDSAY